MRLYTAFMKNSVAEPSNNPRAEYFRRLEALRTTQARYESQHRSLGISKLALGGATLVVIGLALVTKLISVVWVTAPLLAIVVLAAIHERVVKKCGRCSRTIAYYERALARMDNRWMGAGDTGERFQNASHPYSRDLDLFGNGSLFQLLSTARTRAGQETLANWLLAPSSPEVVWGRQAAVAELGHRLDLREDLAVLAEEARSLAPAESLAAWGEGEPLVASQLLRWVSAMLGVLWIVSLVAWIVWGLGYAALLVSAMNLGFYFGYRRRAVKIVSAVESSTSDLALLAGVLAHLEGEEFAAPRLVELREALQSQGWPPSRWITRLSRLMEYLDSRCNMFVSTVDPFVLWTLQCACAVETWRKQTGPAVRR